MRTLNQTHHHQILYHTQWQAPAFCKELECPKYQLVKKIGDDIELRRYEPGALGVEQVKGGVGWVLPLVLGAQQEGSLC